MKLRRMFAATALATVTWVACQKEASVGGNNNNKLVVGKSEIKKGETVTVSLKNSGSGRVARWSVTPGDGVVIDSVYSKQGTEIQFTEPGTYNIQGEVRSVSVNCMPSPGWDTCYKSAPVTDVVSGSVRVTN